MKKVEILLWNRLWPSKKASLASQSSSKLQKVTCDIHGSDFSRVDSIIILLLLLLMVTSILNACHVPLCRQSLWIHRRRHLPFEWLRNVQISFPFCDTDSYKQVIDKAVAKLCLPSWKIPVCCLHLPTDRERCWYCRNFRTCHRQTCNPLLQGIMVGCTFQTP